MLQWSTGYMCLFQFWFPQRICLGVGLLGHMVVLLPVFWGISIPSSIVAVSTYIPTNSARVFPFLPLQHLLFVDFYDGHSNRCEVIYLIVVLICISLIMRDLTLVIVHKSFLRRLFTMIPFKDRIINNSYNNVFIDQLLHSRQLDKVTQQCHEINIIIP